MFRRLRDPGAPEVRAFVEGVPVPAEAGGTLAAVVLRAPEPWMRATAVSGGPRAPTCLMGGRFECGVEVDGRASVQGGPTPVRDGMRVARQRGRRVPSA